jgi:hypothetical protein
LAAQAAGYPIASGGHPPTDGDWHGWKKTMTKAELDLEIRLMAIEYVLVQIGKVTMLTARITPEHMTQMREAGRAQMLSETFPGIDPAMGDHAGAELADRVEGLLGEIETAVLDAYRRLSRGEF